MALPMPSPSKHPKSGVYRIRIGIPAHLRAITKRDHGRVMEFIETLHTKVPAEAKQRAPAIVEKFNAWLRAAQAEHDGLNVHLNDHDVSVLIGQWLADQEAAHKEQVPHPASYYEDVQSDLGDILTALKDERNCAEADARVYAREDISALLSAKGLSVDNDTLTRLSVRLLNVKWQWLGSLAERARSGRVVSTVSSADFPTASTSLQSPQNKVKVDDLLAGWALDRGWRLDAKPMPRPLYDRVRTVARMVDFGGHKEAAKITKADAVGLKTEMLGRGLNAATVRNDLSELSAIWKWGIANGKVTDNPWAGISPPKPKQKAQDKRAFTDAEAATILEAARCQSGFMRWLPWVLCLTGARLNEVVQSDRKDIFTVDGVTVLRIHDAAEDRSVKNAESRRMVPIHPALVAEGFLDYVEALPHGSALFPDIARDNIFGQRAPEAGKRVSAWLKKDLKITDPAISPNHSWRHWFIGACRRVVMPVEVRSALTGHSAKLDESAGCGFRRRRPLIPI